MNLHRMARERAAAGKPVRVGLIGAGKFGSMFLNQIPTMPGVEIAVIADLDPERARHACQTVGWDAARIARTGLSRPATRLAPSMMSRSLSRRRAAHRPASPMPAPRSPLGSISSWSMSRLTCWPGCCWPRRRAPRAWSIRWPMVTSRR